jgi:hypothetical protein
MPYPRYFSRVASSHRRIIVSNEPVREALDEGFKKLKDPFRVMVSGGSIVTFEKRVRRALAEGMVRLSDIQVTPRGYRVWMGRVS